MWPVDPFGPFGFLVTPTLRLIVLKDVDIAGLPMGFFQMESSEVSILNKPNPYNSGRLTHILEPLYIPNSSVTVRHTHFHFPYYKGSGQKFLDVLVEDCRPASFVERHEFVRE